MRYLFRRRHPRRAALAEELLARTRGWQLFTLLEDLLRFYAKESDDARELDGIIARLPARCRTWIDKGLAVMRGADPLESVYWRRLRRTEHRLLIALLGTYKDGRSVVEWLARHGYSGDWRATLTCWLSEMDADEALRLRLGSARSEIIAQMLRGLSDAEALRELRRTYAINEPETALLAQGFKRFRELAFLKPLLEHGLRAEAASAAHVAALV